MTIFGAHLIWSIRFIFNEHICHLPCIRPLGDLETGYSRSTLKSVINVTRRPEDCCGRLNINLNMDNFELYNFFS